MSDADVIVIGSGACGLTAALALARAGKKVLVFEQHDRPGGWTHSFTENGYRFSPGVHYLGRLEEGGDLRRMYDGLGVAQDLVFCELNPDGYDHIVIGEQRFDFPKGRQNLVERLKRHFPKSAAEIDAYFGALVKLWESTARLKGLDGQAGLVQTASAFPSVFKWLRATGKDFIDAYIHDPLLKAVLAGQSGNNGAPPSLVSAIMHAGMVYHYLDGGCYPLGGAFTLPRAFVRALKRAGGEIRLQARVRRILLENRKVIGVELENGEQIRSPIVVSNADPGVTFDRLIGREQLSSRLQRRMQGLRYSVSSLSLFFATDLDLRSAGLDSGNFWYYDHADLDRIYTLGLTDAVLNVDTTPGLFLSITTLKDPSKIHAGRHTGEAFTYVSYAAFEQWAGSRCGNRPSAYAALKEEMTWHMVRSLEKRIPGLSSQIVFASLGTPLTNEHYINATRGCLYGTEKSPDQMGPWSFGPRTEFSGLYLCGASTLSHGVVGATQSGLEAARIILNCQMRDLLTHSGPSLTILPAENPDQWPEHLRRRMEQAEDA